MSSLNYLSAASGILETLAFTRVMVSGLWRKMPYRGFFVMLAVSISREIWLLTVPIEDRSYTLIWLGTLPLVLAAQGYAAIGIFRSIAGLYSGIGKFAILLFGLSLTLAALAGCLALPIELLKIGLGKESILRWSFLLVRSTNSLIAGGMVIAVAFLARLPRPKRKLPANLVLHTILFTTYFSANALLFFAENLFKLGSAVVPNEIFLIFVSLLYLGWCLGLSKKGEEAQAWPGLPAEVTDYIEEKDRRLLQLYRDFASDAWHQATGRK